MAFDLFLLIAAGLTQLGMGVMGIWWSLRPPKPELHALAAGAFALVGFFGLVVVVWAGVRSADSQSSLQGEIERILRLERVAGHEAEVFLINGERVTVTEQLRSTGCDVLT